MRGKGHCTMVDGEKKRITPAHAGKRVPFVGIQSSSQDHPRTCGEKTVEVAPEVKELGSPPHMRGKGNVVI